MLQFLEMKIEFVHFDEKYSISREIAKSHQFDFTNFYSKVLFCTLIELTSKIEPSSFSVKKLKTHS